MNSQGNLPAWGNVQPAGGERHLPIYLLLDTSASMDGAPIESVRQGLEQFQREVTSDPFAREAVKVGVITFNSSARLETNGLVPIAAFQLPPLIASGSTRLDLSFRVLLDSIDRDVVRAVKGGAKGDWRPVVFVLTDGQPTVDESVWKAELDAVNNRPKGQMKPSAIYAVGCGPNVDDDTLGAIATKGAFRMGTSEAAFAALFAYITQSITSSVQPGGDVEDPAANIPLPPNLTSVPIRVP